MGILSAFTELVAPHNLVGSVSGSNIELEWTMPDTTQGVTSFSDDFNTDNPNDPFNEAWEVTVDGINPDIFWERGYHNNAYDPRLDRWISKG